MAASLPFHLLSHLWRHAQGLQPESGRPPGAELHPDRVQVLAAQPLRRQHDVRSERQSSGAQVQRQLRAPRPARLRALVHPVPQGQCRVQRHRDLLLQPEGA
uniref:Uncharacterized protein n=1 Tax=Ixodes ricinus TaxID=34613 RepID=A0A6B0UF88_IXORI